MRRDAFNLGAVRRVVAAVAAVLTAGCGSLNGPGIDTVSPRVTGRVVDASSNRPIAWAQVGRKLWTWRKGGGEFLKGGEELLLLQEYAKTDADGRFSLPGKKVALLFSVGEIGLNLNLTVQAGGYAPWTTNFPWTALSTNAAALEVDAGDIRLQPR